MNLLFIPQHTVAHNCRAKEITSWQKKRLTAKGTTSQQSVGHWTSEQRSANNGCKTSIFSDPFHPAVVDFFREFYKLKLNACIYILFLLPRGYSFCREVFSSAVRFFLLSWVSFFCSEVISFDATVVGHRTNTVITAKTYHIQLLLIS